MTIANLITIGRLLAVPLLVYALINQYNLAAFVLFAMAGISDAVDGYIARHYDQQSELGAWLDPIADKLLMFSSYLFLGIMDHIPDWLVIVVVSRDMLIVGAVVLSSLMGRPVKVAPIMISKVTTVAQVAFAAIVLYALAFGWAVGPVIYVLALVTAGLTVVSGASYLVGWMRHLSGTQA
ncbi:CDP-alcohol phosphatidyltransferase family protein [Rhizobiaceae bacterium n13]|uniref:CDP-diacylglycerol--glycerol-3-phosphate 3-phosphatidyltransferase n=1 Tax=Ferirhizobium litorale TaxID=2927786 RepID=A0AAE3Q8K9_9HYPH|nr:CDP-alcohol phosphatidyltransferase family protein [Fererhizobium litorale]MDI7861050.1 CDP-alcohol phosphatidyltransferase family protein [Fererhizobium litorale]MDI7921197.1 CDP-alcohol phosphatidyltransferase family protein [Fererhizobium litorale]